MKPRAMVRWILCALLALHASVACAQTKTTGGDERIQRVENGLLPSLVEKGKAGRKASLLDRMRSYGVPGISIAVINADPAEGGLRIGTWTGR